MGGVTSHVVCRSELISIIPEIVWSRLVFITDGTPNENQIFPINIPSVSVQTVGIPKDVRHMFIGNVYALVDLYPTTYEWILEQADRVKIKDENFEILSALKQFTALSYYLSSSGIDDLIKKLVFLHITAVDEGNVRTTIVKNFYKLKVIEYTPVIEQIALQEDGITGYILSILDMETSKLISTGIIDIDSWYSMNSILKCIGIDGFDSEKRPQNIE